MNSSITGAGLSLTLVLLAACPASANLSQSNGTSPTVVEPVRAVMPASNFVLPDFNVPTLVEAKGFKLLPLGPELVKIDFDAYMSSIEHLQRTFTRSTDWPHKNISDADAMRDMETEQARFRSRTSFAYAVLTPDGRRERGSVYVSPSPVAGYDAVVRLWVTKAEYDAGFDAELYKWTTEWVEENWRFKKVAYPGRAIEWATWDSLVAAKTAK